MSEKLTKDEQFVLEQLALRPHGMPFRTAVDKEAVLSLCKRALVCDPHDMGGSLFTRITEEGRAVLALSPAP